MAFLQWYGAVTSSLPTVGGAHAVSFPLHHPDGRLPAPLPWRTIGLAPYLLTACTVMTLSLIYLSVVTLSASLYSAQCSTCTSPGYLPVWTPPSQCVFCRYLVWLVSTCMVSFFWIVFLLAVLSPVPPPLVGARLDAFSTPLCPSPICSGQRLAIPISIHCQSATNTTAMFHIFISLARCLVMERLEPWSSLHLVFPKSGVHQRLLPTPQPSLHGSTHPPPPPLWSCPPL